MAETHTDEELRSLEQAVREAEARKGVRDRTTARALHAFGVALCDSGRPRQAKPILERALALSDALDTRDHQRSVCESMGALYFALGDYQAAETMQRRSLALCTEEGRDGSPRVELDLLCSLGETLRKQSQFSEAGTSLRRALAIAEDNRNGIGLLDVANCLASLGRLYREQQHYTEAERFYRACLQIRTREAGPRHLMVGTVLRDLGTMYVKLGQYTEAKRVLKEALEITEACLGHEHPALVTPLNNLAVAYSHHGERDKARRLYQRALRTSMAVYGEEHTITQRTRGNLAPLYCCHCCGRTAPKLMQCGGCEKVHYCCGECQRVDWPSHRDVCKQIRRDRVHKQE